MTIHMTQVGQYYVLWSILAAVGQQFNDTLTFKIIDVDLNKKNTLRRIEKHVRVIRMLFYYGRESCDTYILNVALYSLTIKGDANELSLCDSTFIH